MSDYKDILVNLFKKYNLKKDAMKVFLELFESREYSLDILKNFGITDKDIKNFCTIKQILLDTDECLKKRISPMFDYLKDFIYKFLDLFCNFTEDAVYGFILDCIELGFVLEQENENIFDFYRAQNILSSYT
ncbi:MAG: GGDEF domain-containing protein, partial [Hydrogenobaculum sp.]